MKTTLIAAALVIGFAGLGAGRVFANAGETRPWVETQTAGGALLVAKYSTNETRLDETPGPTVTKVPAFEAETPTATPEVALTPGPEATRAPQLNPKSPVPSSTPIPPPLPSANASKSPLATLQVPPTKTKPATVEPKNEATKEPTAAPTKLVPIEPCPRVGEVTAITDSTCIAGVIRK